MRGSDLHFPTRIYDVVFEQRDSDLGRLPAKLTEVFHDISVSP
jgi:hypothetical protein